MTFLELRKRIYDRLGEDQDDPERYPVNLVQRLLMEAVEQWSLYVGGNVETKVYTMVAGQLEYELPQGFIYPISVIHDETDIPLNPIHYKELYDTEGLGAERRWRNVRSDRPTLYTLFSYNKIWFWPPHSDGGDTITLTYSKAISDDPQSDDTDKPSLPPEFHPLLVNWVVGMCMMPTASGERLERASNFVTRWFEGLEDIRQSKRAPGNLFVRTSTPLG